MPALILISLLIGQFTVNGSGQKENKILPQKPSLRTYHNGGDKWIAIMKSVMMGIYQKSFVLRKMFSHMYLVSVYLCIFVSAARHNKSMCIRCVRVFDNFVLYLGHEHESLFFKQATKSDQTRGNQKSSHVSSLVLLGGVGEVVAKGDHLQVGHKS